MIQEKKEYRLSAIMFTDMQGFSSMMEKNEKETLLLLKTHNDLIFPIIKKYGGNVIKTIGDAVMADFTSAFNAIQCALDIQKVLFDYNQSSETNLKINLRIGVHLGDIYFIENDAFGEGINIASRLQSLARPGSICISQEVYNLVYNKIDAEMISLGQVKLKNISKEIFAFEVFPQGLPKQPKNQDFQEKVSYSEKKQGESINIDENKANQNEKSILELLNDNKDGLDLITIAEKIGFSKEKTLRFLDKMEKHNVLKRSKNEDGTEKYNFLGFFNKHHGIRNRKWDWKQNKFNSGWNENTIDNLEKDDRISNRKTKKLIYSLKDKESGIDIKGIANQFSIPEEKVSKVLNKLENKGILQKFKDEEGKEKYIFLGFSKDKRKITNIELFLQTEEENYKKAKQGLPGNIISFFAVCGLLTYINFQTDPNFLWFIFPTLGWFTGVVNQIIDIIFKKKKKDTFFKTPDLNDEKIKLIKEYYSNDSGLLSNFATFVTINSLIYSIYIQTSHHGFPWYIFPLGGWGIGLISHFFAFLNKRKELKKKLIESKIPIGKKLSISPEFYQPDLASSGNPYLDLLNKTHLIKESLVKQIESSENTKAGLGKEIIPILENYTKKIEQLVTQSIQADNILKEFSEEKIDEEIEYFKNKMSSTNSEMLRVEYSKSLKQWEKQKDSILQLKEQHEIIFTRINSSILTLKQFQLDFARMKAMSLEAEEIPLDSLKQKSDELSEYLTYLKQSYEELK